MRWSPETWRRPGRRRSRRRSSDGTRGRPRTGRAPAAPGCAAGTAGCAAAQPAPPHQYSEPRESEAQRTVRPKKLYSIEDSPKVSKVCESQKCPGTVFSSNMILLQWWSAEWYSCCPLSLSPTPKNMYITGWKSIVYQGKGSCRSVLRISKFV